MIVLVRKISGCHYNYREILAGVYFTKIKCTPLQQKFVRVPSKDGSGTTQVVPVIRVLLRGMQRSDLNLLAAYRKIPILTAPPSSVTYTRANTRAVYRKTVAEIRDLLDRMESTSATADRERLLMLPAGEQHLALVKARYPNIRANVVYARLDARGRGRIQLSAELPLIFAQARRPVVPQVTFPAPPDDIEGSACRTRQAKLLPSRYLETLPVFRYASD